MMIEEGVIELLTPASVQSRQFTERRKGYDPQEVDEFLDEVTHTLTDLGGRLDAAATHVQRVEAELAQAKAQRDEAAFQPQADPSEVAALTEEVAALQGQLQTLVEQARVAEEARAASAAGYEEASGRASALAEQIEAARAAHSRQQSTITSLTSEVEYWKQQLEEARASARPPVELTNAVEVLAAANVTAANMRSDAERDAAELRARVNAEAALLRTDFAALRDMEETLRADVAALAQGVLDWLGEDRIVVIPEVRAFPENDRSAPVGFNAPAASEQDDAGPASYEQYEASQATTEDSSPSHDGLSDDAAGQHPWSAPSPAEGFARPEENSAPASEPSEAAAPSQSSEAESWGSAQEPNPSSDAQPDSSGGTPAEATGAHAWGSSGGETASTASEPTESKDSEGFGSWSSPRSDSEDSDPYGFSS